MSAGLSVTIGGREKKRP